MNIIEKIKLLRSAQKTLDLLGKEKDLNWTITIWKASREILLSALAVSGAAVLDWITPEILTQALAAAGIPHAVLLAAAPLIRALLEAFRNYLKHKND